MTLLEFTNEIGKYDGGMRIKFADGVKSLGTAYGYVKAWHIQRELIQLHMRKFDDIQTSNDVIETLRRMISAQGYTKKMMFDDVSMILRESCTRKSVYIIGNVKLCDGYVGVECVFSHDIFLAENREAWALKHQISRRKNKITLKNQK